MYTNQTTILLQKESLKNIRPLPRLWNWNRNLTKCVQWTDLWQEPNVLCVHFPCRAHGFYRHHMEQAQLILLVLLIKQNYCPQIHYLSQNIQVHKIPCQVWQGFLLSTFPLDVKSLSIVLISANCPFLVLVLLDVLVYLHLYVFVINLLPCTEQIIHT